MVPTDAATGSTTDSTTDHQPGDATTDHQPGDATTDHQPGDATTDSPDDTSLSTKPSAERADISTGSIDTGTGSPGGISRFDVCQRLAAELQIRRPGVHGARMAAYLLRFADGRDLVGVTANAEHAVYYEFASRSLVAVRFDKHGITVGQQELLHRGLDEPTPWVDVHRNELAWVHPRFRA